LGDSSELQNLRIILIEIEKKVLYHTKIEI